MKSKKTVHLKPEQHKRLKIVAVKLDAEIERLVETAIENYLTLKK